MNSAQEAVELNPLAIPADGLSAAYAAQEETPKNKPALYVGLWVLLALIVVNVALWLAYTQARSVWGQSNESIAQSNIAPEKIALLSSTLKNKTPTVSVTTSTAPLAPTISPAAASLTAISSSPTLPLAASASVTPTGAEKTACMVWSLTNKAEANRANNRLAEQAWSGYIAELVDEMPTYMVFVGPFASQKQTDTMLKAIGVLKIKDYSLLPSGSISLGVVSTLEAGKQLQQQLVNRGLKDVQLVERRGKGKLNRYRFEKMSPASLTALQALSNGLGTLVECDKL